VLFVSGRCVLSNHFTDRDSNRGGCCQSCRWKYDLFVDDMPMYAEEDDKFTMGSKDLCMIEYLPELIEVGVDSFKIEGRMKSIHYVATVVNVYRQAIDAYFADPEHFELKQEWVEEINKAANRPLNTGFFLDTPGAEDHIYEPEEKAAPYDFAGIVVDYDAKTGFATVQQRNHFKKGQEIEFVGPEGMFFKQTITEMTDIDGLEIEAARHPLQHIRIRTLKPVKTMDMMRKKIGNK
jgi:U32 family peptidase